MLWPSLSRACLYADLAYRVGDAFTSRLQTLGLVLLHQVDDPHTDTHGYLAQQSDGLLVLGYRGTANMANALEDIEALPADPGNIFTSGSSAPLRVHWGFLRDFLATWQGFGLAIGQLPQERPPIFLCGHSLGGALVTQMALVLATRAYPVAVRTFGSPRVGNAAFAAWFNRLVPDCIRVRHADDVVPTLPDLGYEHVNTLLQLNDDGTEVHPVTRWFQRLLGFDRQALEDIDGQALRAHFLDNYQAAIDAYERRQKAV